MSFRHIANDYLGDIKFEPLKSNKILGEDWSFFCDWCEGTDKLLFFVVGEEDEAHGIVCIDCIKKLLRRQRLLKEREE